MEVKEVFAVFHDVLRLLFITLDKTGRMRSADFGLWVVLRFIHITPFVKKVQTPLLKTGKRTAFAAKFQWFCTGRKTPAQSAKNLNP
ncbi:hypothetical protein FF124_02365 [Martelella lutilitoris]|uniref:Uncharacterized protein n=1 Tax=Martelella lutilitoris TaxID=2583532 RepID=A0A5C4JWY9_9HYPH|nr:hypothetical protein [Martelella lutilitoris]TNB49825.1 hypothetical protein FF124_02365 [Martelella lutilitoris]